jgi:predicted enzyme related to lactoylglutathione lyase
MKFNRREFVKAAGIVGLAGATASTAAAAERLSLRLPGGKLMSGNERHPVVHFEIGCRDLAATKSFYQKMFDWPIDESYQIGEAGIAGHLNSLGHEPQHYILFYVQVEDVAAAIARAESLGGKKLVGPVAIPTGTFAWIYDTEQNVIGLWKAK